MNFLQYLKENYPSLGGVRKIELLESSNINSIIYLVFTDKEKYVLRKFVRGSSPEQMEKVCQISNFCLKNNIKAIESIKNKNNNYVDKERRIYLTKYYFGNLYGGKTSELKEAAKNLAFLHSVLSNYPFEYNYKIDDKYYRKLTKPELKKIEKIIKEKKHNEFDKKVLTNLDYIKKALSSQPVFKIKDKEQLIHFDFQPSNVIFNKNKIVAILDFNAMRKGRVLEDLAFSAFKFSSFNTNNVDRIRKHIGVFVDSYLSNSETDNSKIEYLNDYFADKILGRLSFILKKRYFVDSDSWSCDFDKNINLLKLSKKV